MIRENYITIPAMLRMDYGLVGTELLVAAIIYGFSQDGETEFTGTLDYIAEWTGQTKINTCRVLARLVDKGVLSKYDYRLPGNAKRCTYIVNLDVKSHIQNVNGSHIQNVNGHKQNVNGSHIQNVNNIIYKDNIILEKENILKEKEDAEKSIKKEKSCAKKEKKPYAEYVEMTEEEAQKLTAEFGEAGASRLIEILNNYKGACGKKYKSDYLAIRNWVVKRYEEENGGKSELRKNLEFAAKNGVQSKNIIF